MTAIAGIAVAQVASDPPTNEDWPCIVFADTREVLTANSLRVAVWPDGAILLSSSWRRPSDYTLVGRVSKQDIEAAIDAMSKAGFFEPGQRTQYGVPDAEYATILVRHRGREAQAQWHESLLPDFGGNINSDPEYRTFVRRWNRAAAEISALTPIQLRRLRARTFRGYDPSQPHATVWLDERNW